MTTSVCIERIGVVSPLGIGFPAFCQSVRGADSCIDAGAAPGSALRIADFHPADYFGARSVATLDRMTQLAIAGTGQALDGAGLAPAARRATGVVLGSAGGGFGSISEFVRTTYTAAEPHLVSPLQFPNTVMNCAAAQCAIWHGLTGINASVCAGDLSGIAALQYAMRMLRGGHAATLVAGAVEEYSDFIDHMHGAAAPVRFAEGGAVFMLRAGDRDGRTIATLLGTRMRTVPVATTPHAAALALAAIVQRLLDGACVRPADLAWRSHQGALDADGIGRAASALLGAPDDLTVVPDVAAQRAGASAGAASALHLAGALALAPRGLGLLTAASHGMLGCLLVDHHGPVELPS